MNLRWSWDEPTRDLFRWVDKDAWEAMSHDPVRLLGQVPRPRLDQLAADPGFLRYLQETEAGLGRYLTAPRWFQTRAETQRASPLRLVAYFSPEFGISEALPQYSGGLGVLAGDHLKASSDLGVPLVGVGLFYRSGYFSQQLTVDGMQQERFSELDPDSLALTRCDGIRISVDLAGEPLQAQVWRADVGRVQLYFLDSDVDGNTPEGRAVTDRLYGGDTEHRIRQEILLGIGGVRALQALGLDPQVFHTNEGHAGFLGLERVRQLVAGGLTFGEAVEAVRPGCVFTTHTPVPAGIDRFPEGADGAVLRLLRDGVRRDLRRAHGPRPARRRARRDPLQHGGDGASVGGAAQRRRRAPRRGEPGHVRRAVAGRADGGGPDRLGDERGPRADVDLP